MILSDPRTLLHANDAHTPRNQELRSASPCQSHEASKSAEILVLLKQRELRHFVAASRTIANLAIVAMALFHEFVRKDLNVPFQASHAFMCAKLLFRFNEVYKQEGDFGKPNSF